MQEASGPMRKGVGKGCPETRVWGAEGTEQRPVREQAGVQGWGWEVTSTTAGAGCGGTTP